TRGCASAQIQFSLIFNILTSQQYKHEAPASESFAALETHSLAFRACISNTPVFQFTGQYWAEPAPHAI
ncbi:MAG: hypothetical protein ABGX22_14300, partial [Pirellulaceae bacterium]